MVNRVSSYFRKQMLCFVFELLILLLLLLFILVLVCFITINFIRSFRTTDVIANCFLGSLFLSFCF